MATFHHYTRTTTTTTTTTTTSKDADIQLGVQTLSFACPLSLLRIVNPAKGKFCKHSQCFDKQIFLEFHEHKPLTKWKCTVCNMPVTADTLITDWKFKGYLLKFPNEDKCVIHPDGTSSSVESFKRSSKPGTVGKSDNTTGVSRHNNTRAPLVLVTDSEDEKDFKLQKTKTRKQKQPEKQPENWCGSCKRRFAISDTNLCVICTKPPPQTTDAQPRRNRTPSPRAPRCRTKRGRFCRETTQRNGSLVSGKSRRKPAPHNSSSHRRADSLSPPSRKRQSSPHRKRLFDVSLKRPDVIVID